MIYQPTDKFNYQRKYSGIEVGMIYLLSPGYIKWAIRDLSWFCVADMEYLSSLKVYDFFGGGGSVLAHEVGADQELFRSAWAANLNFEDIKLGGFKPYRLPDHILDLNEQKLKAHSTLSPKTPIVPEEEREVFLFHPGEFSVSPAFKLWPKRIFESSKGYPMVSFEMDNSKQAVKFLPNKDRAKVYSFVMEDWKLANDSIYERIESQKPYEGKIECGILQITEV